jgi:hypothetical protein
MFRLSPVLAITAAFMLSAFGAAADSTAIPKLNVVPGCRAAAKMGDSLDTRLQSCVNGEQAARKELEQKWSQFSSRFKPDCIATAQIGSDSYVQLLECLNLAQDADALRKSSTTGSGR